MYDIKRKICQDVRSHCDFLYILLMQYKQRSYMRMREKNKLKFLQDFPEGYLSHIHIILTHKNVVNINLQLIIMLSN